MQKLDVSRTANSSNVPTPRCLSLSLGLGFPVPGLLSVGYKLYCLRMCMAYLYYERSSYNMAKMAEMSGGTLKLLAACSVSVKN